MPPAQGSKSAHKTRNWLLAGSAHAALVLASSYAAHAFSPASSTNLVAEFPSTRDYSRNPFVRCDATAPVKTRQRRERLLVAIISSPL